MISYEAYKKLFIFSVLIYALLYPIADIGNGVLTMLYFSSTIAFIFSKAAKPEKVDDIKIPEVHLDKSERLNIIGYILVADAVFSAAIFYLVSTYTDFPEGLISIFLWIDMSVLVKNLRKKYTPEDLGKSAIIDYIYTKFDRTLDIKIIRKVIDNTLTIEDDEELINYINNEKLIPDSKKELFKKYFWEYLNLLQNQPDITSEEIEEVI